MMPLPTHNSGPLNQLSNYTSLYQLFAALSVGLAGIGTLRNFIVTKLSQLLGAMEPQMLSAKQRCDTLIKQTISVLYKAENYRGEENKQLGDLLKHQDWLTKVADELTPTNEGKLLSSAAISIFSFVFLSSLTFMCLASFQAEKDLSDVQTFTFLSNLVGMSFVSLFFIILTISWCQYIAQRPVRFAIVVFVLSILICLYLQSHLHFYFITDYLYPTVLSLVVCMSPLGVLITRGAIYMGYIKPFFVKRRLNRISKTCEKANELILKRMIPFGQQ